MDTIFYAALTFTVFLVLALLLAPVILRPSPAARRMLEMVQSNRPDIRERRQQRAGARNYPLPGQGPCRSGWGLPRMKRSNSSF